MRADNGEIGHSDHLVVTLALENAELGDHVVIVTKHFTNLIKTQKKNYNDRNKPSELRCSPH